MNKNVKVGIGVVLTVIGAFLLLYKYTGIPSFSLATRTPEGSLSGSIGLVNLKPLATVVPGGTYQWKIVVKNTGSVEWDFFDLSVFVWIDKSEGIYDDINKWNPQWKWEGQTSWTSGNVFRYNGKVSPGESKTAYLKLKVPSDAEGKYLLEIIASTAYGGKAYELARATDTIEIGTPTGSMTITFLGALSLVAGLGLLVGAVFGKI